MRTARFIVWCLFLVEALALYGLAITLAAKYSQAEPERKVHVIQSRVPSVEPDYLRCIPDHTQKPAAQGFPACRYE